MGVLSKKSDPKAASAAKAAAAAPPPAPATNEAATKASQGSAASPTTGKPAASTLANAAHTDALKMQQIAKLKILLEQKLVSHATLSKQLVEKKSVCSGRGSLVVWDICA